ncbi:unnamed protein product [Vicia faba]|uniref:Uncharacterized protein n=1 Tax=Vicia faba TaxID=3906 RepID=A0AAV0ZR21_VICFA|nr:unnamed protein product [Vicia faba]
MRRRRTIIVPIRATEVPISGTLAATATTGNLLSSIYPAVGIKRIKGQPSCLQDPDHNPLNYRLSPAENRCNTHLYCCSNPRVTSALSTTLQIETTKPRFSPDALYIHPFLFASPSIHQCHYWDFLFTVYYFCLIQEIEKEVLERALVFLCIMFLIL